MIGPLDYHVFAHVEGRYQTAEMSAGVAAAEKAALEQFFFGQTNDERYLSSLSREPGVIWRRCGERYLLTRVLPGARDASNRATLRFETILVPRRQAKAVIDHLGALIVSPWETRPDGAVIAHLRQPAARKLHPDVISDAVMAGRERKRFVRSAADLSLLDVQKIIQSLCDDDEFSLCHKSLNESAAATVNLIADVAKTRRAAVTTTPKPKTTLLPQAPPQPRAVAMGLGVLVLVLLSAVLIMQIVLVVVVLGIGGTGQIEETAQQVILDRIEVRSKDQVRELGDVKSAVLTSNTEVKSALERTIASVDSRVQALDRSVGDAKKELKEELAGGKRKVLESLGEHFKSLKKELQLLARLESQSKGIQKKLTEAIESSGRIQKQLRELGHLVRKVNDLLENIRQGFNDHRIERDERGRRRIVGQMEQDFEELQKRMTELEDAISGE